MKSDYLLPMDSGRKKRTYNLLKHSRDLMNTTYLGCVHDHKWIDQPALDNIVARECTVYHERLKRQGLRFDLHLLANMGSSYPYCIKEEIQRQVQQKRRQLFRKTPFDLLICDSIHMAPNIDFKMPVPKALMVYEIETDLWAQRYATAHGMLRKAYFNYETKRMAAYESRICNYFHMVIASSERAKTRLEEEFKVRVPVKVLETGVDCAFFAPQPEIETIPKRLVFTGSGDLLSNIDGLLWFAAEALPLIRKSHPEVSLDIIGPDPASEIIALSKKDPAIRVTGWVDDIRPYLGAADVFLVPLRVPGGTRVKVYEAMAMKKPVVGTNHGLEGLPVVDGVHVCSGNTAKDLADGIIALFDDQEKRDMIAENGFRMVNEKYDWSVQAKRLVEICEGLVESSKK